MGRIALKREFFGAQGYVEVRFLRSVDRCTGRETIRVKGRKGDYRFSRESFPDLYSAMRYVADRIAAIDQSKGSGLES